MHEALEKEIDEFITEVMRPKLRLVCICSEPELEGFRCKNCGRWKQETLIVRKLGVKIIK